MKVSDYIVSTLSARGVDTIFGYIGGMITHLVDSIGQHPQVRYVQTYHEQSAAFAAEGYVLGGKPLGVAISTSGPGATNMLTGVADAYFDSIPVLYITGQVNSYEYKYDKPIRQQGFQEMDVVSVATPITKYAVLVDDPKRIRYELEKAMHIATTGRKGPVLLDICMDVQRAIVDVDTLEGYTPEEEQIAIEIADIDWLDLRRRIERAKCPVLLAGAGCRDEATASALRAFVERTGIPTLSTLLGRGVLDEEHPYYMGMIGAYGNRCANMSLRDADLLIALGARLDTRQTGARKEAFVEQGYIIHVDIDAHELSCNRLSNRLSVCSTALAFLQQMQRLQLGAEDCWYRGLKHLKANYNQDLEVERYVEVKSPYLMLEELNRRAEGREAYVVDIGQNQMWSAQTLRLSRGQSFFTSGGLAPMGYALPVAVGLAFADSSRPIWAICGDGGFQMSTQSLLLIAQYDLPVRVLLLNNASLGMIAQFQQLYFEGRFHGVARSGGYLMPDVSALSAAYGLSYVRLEESDLSAPELMATISSMRNGIIEFVTEGLTTVAPKLEFDQPIYKPSPQIEE